MNTEKKRLKGKEQPREAEYIFVVDSEEKLEKLKRSREEAREKNEKQ